MLRLHPDRRAKASDLVHHVWLEGIVVQGEIDVVRRAERIEREEKDRNATPNGTCSDLNSKSSAHTLENAFSQSEADAMKPVEALNDGDDDDDEGEGDDQFTQPQCHPQAPPLLSPAPASGAHNRVLHAKPN